MGFRFEGIQEQHRITKGRNRDTAWFRIVAEEWPTVDRHLRRLLATPGRRRNVPDGVSIGGCAAATRQEYDPRPTAGGPSSMTVDADWQHGRDCGMTQSATARVTRDLGVRLAMTGIAATGLAVVAAVAMSSGASAAEPLQVHGRCRGRPDPGQAYLPGAFTRRGRRQRHLHGRLR